MPEKLIDRYANTSTIINTRGWISMSIKLLMMNLGHGEASLVLLDSENENEKVFN